MAPARTSRRQFLTATASAFGAAALAFHFGHENSLVRILSGLRRRSPADLSQHEIEVQVGSSVSIWAQNGTRFSARIAKVANRRPDPKLEQFSVLLETELREALPQGSFEIEHPKLGTCELFLVPVVTRRDRIDYEAVFCRFAA